MKKIIISIFSLLIGSGIVLAQNDPKAQAILNELSKKYKTFDVVKTDFTFTLNNPSEKIKESKKGTLFVRSKANKFRVVFPDTEVMSDGKTIWTYLKDDKEVQVTDVNFGADAVNPAQIFTIYEKGYKYVFAGEKKQGNRTYQFIELAPTTKGKAITKVKLKIDKAAKQISTVEIFNRDGNVYQYTVNTFVPNAKVTESTFAFDSKKYPGVEVVDLR